jgi:hypothetical protein
MSVHRQISQRQRAALASICGTFFPADNGVPATGPSASAFAFVV